MKFLRLISMFFAAAILAAAAHAAEAFWFTDYQAAAKQASAENRPMLLDFTGSDWCPWCIKLDQEVYSQPTFIDFARQHLVLVKLDFPRQKQLPVAEKNQNRTLAKKFDVHGYPTSVLLDAQGNKLGQYEGYMEGGPHAYIEWVESLKK